MIADEIQVFITHVEQSGQPALSTETKTATKTAPPSATAPVTRVDFYLEHLREARPRLPEAVHYGVFDGYYAKRKFIDGVCGLSFWLNH